MTVDYRTALLACATNLLMLLDEHGAQLPDAARTQVRRTVNELTDEIAHDLERV
jgi:hypothetical protein